ncbi:Hypothetical predicted protein [Podarcis lilfordi]|uniref:Uncharacterized protein n=1 Tax=Podarcis lilfordi TaxID=74358 RepID=A0AA35KKV7_9SAUR|nr:Hypothetical predicted protein [Podarcis lilfordi]
MATNQAARVRARAEPATRSRPAVAPGLGETRCVEFNAGGRWVRCLSGRARPAPWSRLVSRPTLQFCCSATLPNPAQGILFRGGECGVQCGDEKEDCFVLEGSCSYSPPKGPSGEEKLSDVNNQDKQRLVITFSAAQVKDV